MNEWRWVQDSCKQGVWIQDGSIWIQHGRIQDGCHHQVKWEWMSLSQIELVGVRVRVEWEGFWVNLRKENKVSESKMAVSESNMAEFKMSAITNMSQNEWVKSFFVQKKILGTNLGKCEWVWEDILKWINQWWSNSRWLPSPIWVRMNQWSFFLCKWWEPILVSVSEFERKI